MTKTDQASKTSSPYAAALVTRNRMYRSDSGGTSLLLKDLAIASHAGLLQRVPLGEVKLGRPRSNGWVS